MRSFSTCKLYRILLVWSSQWGFDWCTIYHRLGRWDSYKILVEKPEEKRTLGKPRRSWEGNISMGLLA